MFILVLYYTKAETLLPFHLLTIILLTLYTSIMSTNIIRTSVQKASSSLLEGSNSDGDLNVALQRSLRIKRMSIISITRYMYPYVICLVHHDAWAHP